MNRDFLLPLVGKVIKVDRGGPESRVGVLLCVESDYFVLFTKPDGVVYYKTQHVKSISVDTKDNFKKELEMPSNLEYYKGENFKAVIKNFRHKWVKINRGGPESVEGILNEVENDYVTVVFKQEVIYVAMFHIRNISSGVKNQEEENKEDSKNNDSKNNKSKWSENWGRS